jgi:RNA polymerase sigma-70 factor (ECF subfamily)
MPSSADLRRDRFETLLRPHLDRLYRFAFRLAGSKPEAEDLFQDVLTKMYARVESLIDIDKPGSWLCRIMYNHFIDDRRRYARQRLVSGEEAQLPGGSLEGVAGDLDPVADRERHEKLCRLDAALSTLSDDHRLVLMLHDVEAYKLSEIRDMTGTPIGTLKSRLHRARDRLRDILVADGTFPDG